MGYMEWRGWICPRCGQVWAPWVAHCKCAGLVDFPNPPIRLRPIYEPPYPFEQSRTGDPIPIPNTITICDNAFNYGQSDIPS